MYRESNREGRQPAATAIPKETTATTTLEVGPPDGGEGEVTEEEEAEAEAIWRPLAEVARYIETICLMQCSYGLNSIFLRLPKWRFKK